MSRLNHCALSLNYHNMLNCSHNKIPFLFHFAGPNNSNRHVISDEDVRVPEDQHHTVKAKM